MKILKDIYYGTEKNTEKTLDFYIPQGDCRAVMLTIHGGGMERGSKEGYDFLGKYLAERGFGLITINYRMYPKAKYPDFIYDAAEAVAWALSNIEKHCKTRKLYVGGSSAGGYISMMLCFDKRYYESVGVSNFDIAGYWHDAGQPTAHFNVLKYAGEDSRRLIVDERAPLYFVGNEESYPPMRFTVSDNDMAGRYEQTMLMLKTLENFGYKHFDHIVMHGRHCQYLHDFGEDGEIVGAHLVEDFLLNADKI